MRALPPVAEPAAWHPPLSFVDLVANCPKTSLGVLLVAVAVASCGPRDSPRLGPDTSPIPRPDKGLELGRTLDLDLEASTPWRTSLSVEVDSYCVLVVEQPALDVRLSVLDSSDEEVARARGAEGLGADERLAVRLRRGEYEVLLDPAEVGPTRGRVRLRLESLRPWRANDARRVQLEALGSEANRLDDATAAGGYPRALELTRAEAAGWRLLGDKSSLVRALNRMTSLERALGKLEDSVRHGREAVAVSAELEDPRLEGASRYWLAMSLHRSGELDEAAEQFERAAAAARAARDRRLQGKILNWQGRAHRMAGRLSEAYDYFSRSLDHRRAAHDVRGTASTLNNLALVAKAGGMLKEALGYYEESIELARRTGVAGADLQSVSNMAELLFARGQWQEALAVWREALARAIDFDSQRREATLATSLARALVTLGEPEQARPLLMRALEIERRRREQFAQILVLVALGWVDTASGQLASAEKHFLEARRLCRDGGLPTQEVTILRGLATLSLQSGEPHEALRLLREIESNASREFRPALRSRELLLQSEAHLQAGDVASSALALSAAIEALGTLAVPEIRFHLAFQSARVHSTFGEADEALADAELALDIAESLRSRVNDPDLRATYLSRVREAYDFTVDLLLGMEAAERGRGHAERAFATVERARARSLVEMLATAKGGAEGAVDSALLEQERNSLAAVAFARQKLEAALSGGGASEEDLDELQRALTAAEGQLRSDEQRIRDSAPRYAALRYPEPVSVEEVRRHLAEDEAFVEYWLRGDRAAAFVITREDFESVRLPIESDLPLLVEAMRLSASQPSRRSFGRLYETSRALGEQLLDPLLDTVGSKGRLTLVPDGLLNYLPFEALQIGSPTSYVVRHHAVTYAPSASVWLTLDRDRGSEGGFVAFADPICPDRPAEAGQTSEPWPPLPGARAEVEAIAATFEGNSTVLAGGDASEGRLKEEQSVRSARWLHLASHARVVEDDPASTSVVLGPDRARGHDGYLTVSEVFELELQADLVVLSGCETALGRQVSGEGLIGLTRAFLYAGARGVGVSLWKVADDTTPELMSSFYGALANGADPAQALRSAKLQSLSDPGRSHPFHWAPFILVGGAIR